MSETFALSAIDYAIFGIMLLISAGIGVYFRIFGGKQISNDEYLLAGKDMPIFPVAFSLMATFMSATTLMGIPSEMYFYGINMAFMNIGFLLGPIISSFVFLPIYFKTGVSTSYEYLEKRFGKSTRWILSGIFLIQNMLFNSVSLYAPALALSAVTNLSLWTSVICIGAVCTFYCTLGGMKAVVWTDVFQSVLMYFCLLAIIVKGSLDFDGLQNIFSIANEGGRLVLPTFEIDFSRQYTMLNIFLQGLIITCYCYGVSQTQVQRQLTLRNLKRSSIAAILSALMNVVFHLLCCLCGFIFYAQFKKCDPIASPENPIQSADQLMPYYVITTMGQYPGVAGLCIAGIFSASLSSISSGVNSMAAVTYEDIIRPIWKSCVKSVFVTKTASVFYGILSILLVILVSFFGTLVKANVLIIGMLSGPTLGVYLLAVFTKRTNEMGVNFGVLGGFLFAGWATLVTNDRYYPHLPVEENCSDPTLDFLNSSMASGNFSTKLTEELSDRSIGNESTEYFPVSYMWISTISLLVCLFVGYFGSLLILTVPVLRRRYNKCISPDLTSPVLRWFCEDLESKKGSTKIKRATDFSTSKF